METYNIFNSIWIFFFLDKEGGFICRDDLYNSL